MRHGKKISKLGRSTSHRKALMGNLASELIKHKRINTTLAKGKALRKYVEPILTKAKHDSVHNRRLVYKMLLNNAQARVLVKELFSEIGPKIADRPGGYTRIIKLPPRLGDNADMCFIELVDYNELLLNANSEGSGAKKTRRSRRSSGKKTADNTEETVVEAKEKAPKIESKAEDLTKIEGIGPKINEALQANGITSFSDLADATADEIKKILEAADGNFASHDPTTWPQQAKLAAEGKWDELKKWQDELDGGKEVNNSEDKE